MRPRSTLPLLLLAATAALTACREGSTLAAGTVTLTPAQAGTSGCNGSNQVFTPPDEKVQEAREILAAMEEAKASGAGATVYKGRLVDIASIKQAEVIVAQAELIAGS